VEELAERGHHVAAPFCPVATTLPLSEL
jgi:hypothetical protein